MSTYKVVHAHGALLNPETSIAIQKCHSYTRNINSETSEDSTIAILRCDAVLGVLVVDGVKGTKAWLPKAVRCSLCSLQLQLQHGLACKALPTTTSSNIATASEACAITHVILQLSELLHAQSHLFHLILYLTVWGVEPDATHQTSESTGVCGVRQNQAGGSSVPKTAYCQRRHNLPHDDWRLKGSS